VARVIDPGDIAKDFRKQVAQQVAKLTVPLKLVGFLSADNAPSQTYANYTKAGCDDVGIQYELRQVNKLALAAAIDEANADPAVHGIMVYYPIFATDQDAYIKDLVDHRKDIEGLNSYWVRMLYHNQRYVDAAKSKQALLPCTPLAVIKLLEAAGALRRSKADHGVPLQGQTVVIFNRSEVVGRPLASMLANDGANVYSFDIDGPQLFRSGQVSEFKITRAEALSQADIVITGVPSREFPLVHCAEIRPGAVCLNFSTLRNFVPEIGDVAGVFIPRVGPMTVAMALRNTLRLFENYHA